MRHELTRRDEDFYFVGSAAAGFTIGRLTVRPGVTIPMGLADDRERYYVRPFGRENREIAFEIAVGISFGRRTPSPLPD